MHEELVFALGAWQPRHRPDLNCWCHPELMREDGLLFARHRPGLLIAPERCRQRAFISGPMQAPV